MAPVPTNQAMQVNDQAVKVTKIDGQDYICLTDMAKSFGAERAVESWLRNKNTVEFLGVWERFYNQDFNLHEFVGIKSEAGLNRFNISVKEWAVKTNAKGLVARTGRYGGTYAHKDIAFEFGTWLSPEFKLLVIHEYQRLKAEEETLVEWDSHRFLSKANYRLHTDAIREYIIPALSPEAIHQYVYINEADMLNRIAFGLSASEWRKQNPEFAKSKKNQRDYASAGQLLIVANLENLNSYLISEGEDFDTRIDKLTEMARKQYASIILENDATKELQ